MPSEQVADLKSLVADMNAGKVQWLVMLGVNPMYSAPVDLEFRGCVRRRFRTRCIWARTWTRRAAICELAHQQGALSRELVGCARVRRDDLDHSADD